jgi:hypothetical protein
MNPGGKRGGKTATPTGKSVAARFPAQDSMKVQRNLIDLEGRVRSRSQDAGRAQNSAWDIKGGSVRGNYAAMQRLADKRIARIKPAQRAVDRYRRMAQNAGYKV